MAIRHVVTIQVAPGKAADFASAFTALQAIAQQEEGCEQYELFQSLDDPDRVVLLERWASQALLDKHMEAERTRNRSPVDALVALWGLASPRLSNVSRFRARRPRSFRNQAKATVSARRPRVSLGWGDLPGAVSRMSGAHLRCRGACAASCGCSATRRRRCPDAAARVRSGSGRLLPARRASSGRRCGRRLPS
jgi:quinol monooxygenase YgiN